MYMYIYVCISIFIYIFLCIYICMYIYVYISVCTYNWGACCQYTSTTCGAIRSMPLVSTPLTAHAPKCCTCW